MAEKILCLIFILRPVIDLAWDHPLLLGMNLAGVTAVLTICLTAARLAASGKIPADRVSQSGTLFLVFVALSVILFQDNFEEWAFFLRAASAFCFFLVVAPNITQKRFESCLMGFLIVTIIPILLTYLQAAGMLEYTYFDYIGGCMIGRGSGGYRQPSVLTRFCVFGLLYAWYFFETRWKTLGQKMFGTAYVLLNLCAVFLSYHRTGYFLILVLSILWFFQQARKNMGRFMQKIILISTVGITFFWLLYSLGAFTLDLSGFTELLSLENIASFEDGQVTLVLRGRSGMIHYLLDSFFINPWYNTLIGNGGTINRLSGRSMITADMDFIRILWNCGIVGFILWILHFASMWISLRRRKYASGSSSEYRLGICIFVSFLIWGLTVEATAVPNITSHVYLICGYVSFNAARKKQLLNRGYW